MAHSVYRKCAYCSNIEERTKPTSQKVVVCSDCKYKKTLILRAKDANCGIKECSRCHKDFLDTVFNFNNKDYCRKCNK